MFYFSRFYFFHGGPSFYERPCDRACKHEMLCHLLSSDSGNRVTHCAQLKEEQERVDREKEAKRSFLRLQQEEEEEEEPEEEEEESWWSSLFRR